MSELFIDAGNSFIKAARPEGKSWSVAYTSETANPDPFLDWLNHQPDSQYTLCSVVQGVTNDLRTLFPEEDGKLKILRSRNIPARFLSYDTTETLGMDRFLVCLGARSISGGSVVVIDSGSACTIDYMSDESVFMGGVIMPGMELIRQASADALRDLPASDLLIPESWPGKSTMDCLRWGTGGAFLESIYGFLHRFSEHYGPFTLFLTGGDAEKLSGMFTRKYHPVSNPHLLFDGMRAFRQLIG